MEPWMGVLLFGLLLSKRDFGSGDLPARRDNDVEISRRLVR